MANNTYDTHAYNYNEREALQRLVDVVSSTAINENERIMQGIHVDDCESFTITVGGVQIAFALNAPQCCALDAFVETLARESGYTINDGQ